MRPVFEAAKKVTPERSRIIFAEGEDERVLRAAQTLVDEKICAPILVGRPEVIEDRLRRRGLRLKPGVDVTIVNTQSDPRYNEYANDYHRLMARRGVTPQYAKLEMRRRSTLIAAMLLRKGEGDGLICGTISTTDRHLVYINDIIGHQPGATVYAAMNLLILQDRQLFIVDTHINADPTADQLAEITTLAAEAVRRFGIIPKAALLSHSNFGSIDSASSRKMRDALDLIRKRAPGLEIDGEMHADCALDEEIRRSLLPETTLRGSANLLVMPNIEAANITYNLLKVTAGHNVAIGPILLGCARPVHILTPAATVRRIINMAALAVVEADLSRR
jgi:malate dehydrogenase (oxaloacetate-decarboxylating)(NADP+)